VKGPPHNARRVRNALSLSLNKERAKERQPKGLVPFGNPQCEKVAALSLCSSFRKSRQFQRLRLQVKKLANTEVARDKK